MELPRFDSVAPSWLDRTGAAHQGVEMKRWHNMFSLKDLRDGNGGEYPATIDGGYPVMYLDKENYALCAPCANSEDEPVVSYFVHYEGDPEDCEGCGAVIVPFHGA